MPYEKIEMPVVTQHDIGDRFQSALGTGKYVNKLEEWYGLYNGQKIMFRTISRILAQLDTGGDLIEITRQETVHEYSALPNGKKLEMETTYQRVALPGQSQNARDLVPETMTKNVTKKFFYSQLNEQDEYRYVLSSIVTQEDYLCVINGIDNQGRPRDPYPVQIQQNGISYRVAETGIQLKFIEGFRIATKTFSQEQTTTHEPHTGVSQVEMAAIKSPPIITNLAEPCTPDGKIVKVVKGTPNGKTLKIENPNIIHTNQANNIADEILVINSWIKQINRSKTYLGIIPIHIINQRAGNIGYTITVDHMSPSAITKIDHREMVRGITP